VRAAVPLAAALLAARAAWPAPANAADLFPVDDWLGSGIKKAGDVVLGPLKLGVKEIAQLLAAIVGALADLLVPKSLVNAGLGGIKWLVQLPPVGSDATPEPGVPSVRMPHLQELRDTMTWIGITLLPLGIVITAGRAFLAPTADGDSPADIFGRALTAGLALLLYDWAWGVVTELSRLLTGGLLGLPWVADGVERMLQTLVIGGATGSAAAAEFVVPLMIMIAGTVLLGLLLVRVGLEVATALLYVLGGLVLGLSVTNLGRRLLTGWLIAAGAIVALPLLWSTVFAVGAALMLDAGDTAGKGDLAAFVAQLYNVAAALAVFWIAIKLALGVFRHASGAITGITTTPASAGVGGARSSGRVAALAQHATPAGLARFSQGLRGSAATGVAYPIRHPARTAQAGGSALRHPVAATRDAAAGLSDAFMNSTGRTPRPERYPPERGRGGDSTPTRQDRANPHGAADGGESPTRRPTANTTGGARVTRGASAQPPADPNSRATTETPATRRRSSSRAPDQPRPAVPQSTAPRDAAAQGEPKSTPAPPSRPNETVQHVGVTRPAWLRRPKKPDRDNRKREQ
jgi:hypothetical protein